MSVKRWKGAASGAWATLNSGGNYNWLKGDGSNATEIPRSAGSDVKIDAATYNDGTETLSITTNAAHGLAAGDSIRFKGFVSATNAWATALNWTNPNVTSGPGAGYVPTVDAVADGTHFTVTSLSLFQQILLASEPAGSLTDAYVTFQGDDVQMLSSDKTTYYCTTGPTSAITVNSLTITVAAGVTTVGILGSGSYMVTVASTFSYTDAADSGSAITTASTIFGQTSATAGLTLASGCVGTVIGQPPHTAMSYTRSGYLQVPAGSALNIRALPFSGVYTTGVICVCDSVNCSIGGTYTLLSQPVGDDSNRSGVKVPVAAAWAAGFVLNVNHVLTGVMGTSFSVLGTVNVGASVVWGGAATSVNANGFVINTTASLVVYSTLSMNLIADNTTINAYAPVALANFNVATGKTLSVNSFGYPVEVCDVTGTVNVTGARVSTAGVGKSPLVSTGA
ncbi:MAG: hypothetical protein NTV86_13085 [Planctomycetota bacterium]|nr:hypothetical protein [Planctomycetota bacterium]